MGGESTRPSKAVVVQNTFWKSGAFPIRSFALTALISLTHEPILLGTKNGREHLRAEVTGSREYDLRLRLIFSFISILWREKPTSMIVSIPRSKNRLSTRRRAQGSFRRRCDCFCCLAIVVLAHEIPRISILTMASDRGFQTRPRSQIHGYHCVHSADFFVILCMLLLQSRPSMGSDTVSIPLHLPNPQFHLSCFTF